MKIPRIHQFPSFSPKTVGNSFEISSKNAFQAFSNRIVMKKLRLDACTPLFHVLIENINKSARTVQKYTLF